MPITDFSSEAWVSQSDGTWVSVAGPLTPPSFVYRVTMPDPTIGNVGLQVDPASLTPVTTAFTPTAGQTYTGFSYENTVNLAGKSNVQFENCAFPGRILTASTGTRVVTASGAGTGGVAGAVVSPQWGAVGQNYFKFCDFTPASRSFSYASAIGGHHFYLDRCVIPGGTDNMDWFTFDGQNAYNEAWGCWIGSQDGAYPDTVDPSHTDGTHCDGCEITSGSYHAFIGCVIQGLLSTSNPPGSGQSPYYPVSNAAVSLLQNMDGGHLISNVIIDSCWIGGGHVGAIQVDSKISSGGGRAVMKHLSFINNRGTFIGLTRNLTSPTVGGVANPYYDSRALANLKNWFTNLGAASGGGNQPELTEPTNNFSGNITYSSGNPIVSPYQNAS